MRIDYCAATILGLAKARCYRTTDGVRCDGEVLSHRSWPLMELLCRVRSAFRHGPSVNSMTVHRGEVEEEGGGIILLCVDGEGRDVVFKERKGTRWLEVRRTRLLPGSALSVPPHLRYEVRRGRGAVSTLLCFAELPDDGQLVSPPSSPRAEGGGRKRRRVRMG